jgi:hypothetical protein
MRDYKKHLTLLPHKWQNVGLVALAIVVVCSALYMGLHGRPEDQILFGRLVCTVDLLLTVSALLVCFSGEKVEDEYITSARYRALTIVVFLLFVSRATKEMITGGYILSDTVYDAIGQMVNEQRLSRVDNSIFVRFVYKATYWLSNFYVLALLYIVLLKMMVRFGNGNGFKSILLPYRCKKAGWRILIISAVLIPLVIYYLGHVLVNNMDVIGRTPDRLVYIKIYITVSRLIVLLPYVGLLMVCLSREEQEDEFISHIRVRMLAYFVIYYLIASFIAKQCEFSTGLMFAQHGGYWHPSASYFIIGGIGDILYRLTWVPLVALVYTLVLRKVLSKNLKESSNEE